MIKLIGLIVLFGLILSMVSCTNNQKVNEKNDNVYAEEEIVEICEEVQEEQVVETKGAGEEEMQVDATILFKPFFDELKGIEKFFVKKKYSDSINYWIIKERKVLKSLNFILRKNNPLL